MKNDEELKNTTPSIENSEENTPIIENTDDLGPVPDTIIPARNFGEEDFNEPNEEPSQEPPLNDDNYASEENEEGTRVLNSSEELREEFWPSVFDSGFTSESENQPQVEQEAQKSFEEEDEVPTIISQTAAPEDRSKDNPNYFDSDTREAEEEPNVKPIPDEFAGEAQKEDSQASALKVNIQSANDFVPSASLDMNCMENYSYGSAGEFKDVYPIYAALMALPVSYKNAMLIVEYGACRFYVKNI